MAGGYGSVLKQHGVARIIAAQLVARFPSGMLSLGVLLHVERVHNSYGSAGLVLGAFSVGQALAGPLTSRLMGRVGMRPVLAVTTLLCAAALTGIALLVIPIFPTMVVSFVAGMSMPPIASAVRTIYPKMVNASQLTPLFSLDASAQELIWITGPVAITFVSVQVSTTLGVLLCAVVMLLGGAWFIASPELGRVRIPRSPRRFGAVLKRPPVILSTVIGFLLIGSCAAVEAGIVSHFDGSRSTGGEGGIVLAIWSLGSLIGGLSFGHLPLGPWALARRMVIVFVGVAIAGLWLQFWWLAVMLLISGMGIAPALAAMSAMTSSSVKFSDTAEAYGWIGTGQLIGAGLGSAVAGAVIDSAGSQGAFWIAAGFALVATIVPALCVKWLPDLRGRDATPIPDTEPFIVPDS